ncbi:MAG TPA: hypothetical protein VH280_21285 [Verrucomicrobiae bacterium]|jgi:hypothetical protein|nr:hypothetical protein [Verrucomicrobiae bacterium]
MIIWQGLGFLVFAIVFGCSLIANLIFNAKAGAGYYDHHKWPFAVSLLVSAAICWSLGDYLRKRSDRVVIDKQTGREFVINQSRHTMFWIPMHWWGPILFVGALILFAIELS